VGHGKSGSRGIAEAISLDVYAHFVACTENLEKLRAARIVVDKLAEILEESEAFYEHEREADISIIADAVRSAARRKDDSIRAPFAKTLKYNSQVAEKAVKTRRKNAQAAAQAQPGEPAKTPAEPPAPTP
jgi:hypothetical protein